MGSIREVCLWSDRLTMFCHWISNLVFSHNYFKVGLHEVCEQSIKSPTLECLLASIKLLKAQQKISEHQWTVFIILYTLWLFVHVEKLRRSVTVSIDQRNVTLDIFSGETDVYWTQGNAIFIYPVVCYRQSDGQTW